jgi:hypothetical protein
MGERWERGKILNRFLGRASQFLFPNAQSLRLADAGFRQGVAINMQPSFPTLVEKER